MGREKFGSKVTKATIALIGDYDATVPAHVAIPKAIELANATLGTDVAAEWIHTSELTGPVADHLHDHTGIWAIPASPYANMDGALAAIRFARETNRPFLGTCGGFQHALIEYVRNVLGHAEADNLESNPNTEMPLVAPLECALVEKSGDISFTEHSRLSEIFKGQTAHEGYRCSYGFNDDYRKLIDASPLNFTGFDPDGSPRAMELPDHPFFMATLFQPERAALRGESHPLVEAFVQAVSGPQETL